VFGEDYTDAGVTVTIGAQKARVPLASASSAFPFRCPATSPAAVSSSVGYVSVSYYRIRASRVRATRILANEDRERE
jgi:hypothetical protein